MYIDDFKDRGLTRDRLQVGVSTGGQDKGGTEPFFMETGMMIIT
jgi:hypothetical protein